MLIDIVDVSIACLFMFVWGLTSFSWFAPGSCKNDLQASSHLNYSNFMSCYCKECAIVQWFLDGTPEPEERRHRCEAHLWLGNLNTLYICSDIMERSFYRLNSLNNSIFWVDLRNLWMEPLQRFSSFLLILGGVWASTEVHGAATTQHWVGGSVFGWGSSPVWSSNLLC